MAKKYKSRNRASGQQRLAVTIVAVLLIVALSAQLFSLYRKKQFYEAREALLEQQLEDAKERQQELEDQEAYTGTIDYIISIARSKLGLIFPDEIIFKEE